MNKNFVDFGLPAWWILPAVLVSFGLAYWLYTKPGIPWSKNQNLILGSIRFLAILLILLLFLNPLIRHVINEIERPIVVIGVDNSLSISSAHSKETLLQLTTQLTDLQEKLEKENDYMVVMKPLIGDSLTFDGPYSDLSTFFKQVEDEYLGKNVSAVALVTDGIYNRGVSPTYLTYGYPIYTLGMGDTIPRRDVSIREVRHNSVAYQGNEFPFRVEVTEDGYDNLPFEISIRKGGAVLVSENGNLKPDGNSFTFFLTADQTGLQHYTVSISRFDGEATFSNNTYDVFMEVLESKKKIRMAARSPQPDMRAIRGVLEETGNYEVFIDIPGMQNSVKEQSYDVQILFDDLDPIGKSSGIWRILSDPTKDALNKVPFVKIDIKGRPDRVIPNYNGQFSRFKLNRQVDRLKRYPPISVPFGDYQLSGPVEVLLYQQVGSVTTDKPLLAVFDNGNQRQAVMLGSGIWQWRLQEAARFSDEFLFSEIIQKLVQYLSISDSKQQFRVSRGMDVFTEGDVVFFDVEIFDDIFQPLEAQPYSIEITPADGNKRTFEYVFGSENKSARASAFESGTYRYKATTTVGDKRLTTSGEFVVNALQLEQRSLTADHDLLKRLSQRTEGSYAHLNDFKQFEEMLRETKFQGIIRSDTNREPFIKLLWVLILIMSLLSSEWLLRKFWGAY